MCRVTHSLGVVGLEDAGSVLDHDSIRPRLVTVRKDQSAVIIDADPQIHRVLGWDAADLAGRRALDLVHPDDQQRAIAGWMDFLATPPGEARRIRLRHLHRDGRVIWFEITNHNRLADPAAPCVFAEMLDIGDEFVVVCRDVPRLDLAGRIAASLGAATLDIGPDTVRPAASVGVAWTRAGGLDADALIAHADSKMYEAKKVSVPAARRR